MQRALDLARLGMGSVSPNPMVGAVLVHEDTIIGEGWHRKFGGAHAEVEAITSVKDPSMVSKCTLYVTLEPCNHHGKTPPCTDLIISQGIKNVVVAMTDPNPMVGGKGIEKLRQHGVNVQLGMLEAKAKVLNKRFITYYKKRRPYVILKWAQSADGYIAPSLVASKEEKQISGPLSTILTHKWRSEEDAMMVGFNTLLHDNPQLTARNWTASKQPVRISLEERGYVGQLPWSLETHLPSLIFHYQEYRVEGTLEYIPLQANGHPIDQLLAYLRERGVASLLVEGGTQLLNKFILAGAWDEARICTSQKLLLEGIGAPCLFGVVKDKLELEGDIWEVIQNPLEEIAT